MFGQESKLVLLPFGRTWSSEPYPQGAASLSSQLDVLLSEVINGKYRCIQNPGTSAQLFVQANRLPIEGASREPGGAFVVLTRTAIMSDLVNMRLEMEKIAPELKVAIWIVYDKVEPRFVNDLRALGTLEENEVVTHCPIWAVAGHEYLIWTPLCQDFIHMKEQVRRLVAKMDPRRGPHRSPSTSSMAATQLAPHQIVDVNSAPTVRPSTGTSSPALAAVVTSPPQSGPRPKPR